MHHFDALCNNDDEDNSIAMTTQWEFWDYDASEAWSQYYDDNDEAQVDADEEVNHNDDDDDDEEQEDHHHEQQLDSFVAFFDSVVAHKDDVHDEDNDEHAEVPQHLTQEQELRCHEVDDEDENDYDECDNNDNNITIHNNHHITTNHLDNGHNLDLSLHPTLFSSPADESHQQQHSSYMMFVSPEVVKDKQLQSQSRYNNNYNNNNNDDDNKKSSTTITSLLSKHNDRRIRTRGARSSSYCEEAVQAYKNHSHYYSTTTHYNNRAVQVRRASRSFRGFSYRPRRRTVA